MDRNSIDRYAEADRLIDTVFEPGTWIGERYRVEGVLGQGGMAIVYRAFDDFLGRLVALKVMRISVAAHVARFEREAGATAALCHPSVVRVYDYGTLPGGQPYLALELVHGESLQKMLDRSGAIEPQRALELMCPVAGALAEAHEVGIVHRDIKPDNLVLQRASGMRDMLRLLDFSIAVVDVAEGERLTATGQFFGTPEFMSPEQAMGQRVDDSADIWAVGAVLYTLLSGQEPFRGDHTPEVLFRVTNSEPDPLPSDLPKPLRDLVTECLQKTPAARPQNGTELLWRLEHCLAKQAPMRSGTLVGPVPMRPPEPRGSRWRIAAGAGVGALLMGGAWLGVGLLGDGRGTGSEAETVTIAGQPATPNLVEVASVALDHGEAEAALRLLQRSADSMATVGGSAAQAETRGARRMLVSGLANVGAKHPELGFGQIADAVELRPILARDPRVLTAILAAVESDPKKSVVAALARSPLVEVAKERLLEMASDGRAHIRWSAVEILVAAKTYGRQARVAALEMDLEKGSCAVRRLAAQKLARLGARSSLPALRRAAQRPAAHNRCMRRALEKAIAKLTR